VRTGADKYRINVQHLNFEFGGTGVRKNEIKVCTGLADAMKNYEPRSLLQEAAQAMESRGNPDHGVKGQPKAWGQRAAQSSVYVEPES